MTSLKTTVRRVTNTELDSSFGPDRHRRIVVALVPGNGRDTEDSLMLKPFGTRRWERGNVADVYRWLIRSRANVTVLEKARAKKAKKQIRLAAQRQMRAEKRLFSEYPKTIE